MPAPYPNDYHERVERELYDALQLLRRTMNILVRSNGTSAIFLNRDIAIYFANLPEENDKHKEESRATLASRLKQAEERAQLFEHELALALEREAEADDLLWRIRGAGVVRFASLDETETAALHSAIDAHLDQWEEVKEERSSAKIARGKPEEPTDGQ